jgi:hypothetical protein
MGELTMYKQSNPTSSAVRAENPSYTPGAKIKLFGSLMIFLSFAAAGRGGVLIVSSIEDIFESEYTTEIRRCYQKEAFTLGPTKRSEEIEHENKRKEISIKKLCSQ